MPVWKHSCALGFRKDRLWLSCLRKPRLVGALGSLGAPQLSPQEAQSLGLNWVGRTYMWYHVPAGAQHAAALARGAIRETTAHREEACKLQRSMRCKGNEPPVIDRSGTAWTQSTGSLCSRAPESLFSPRLSLQLLPVDTPMSPLSDFTFQLPATRLPQARAHTFESPSSHVPLDFLSAASIRGQIQW